MRSRGTFSITSIYDKSGYSPLHFGAYKNSEKICKVLIDFILEGDNKNISIEE